MIVELNRLDFLIDKAGEAYEVDSDGHEEIVGEGVLLEKNEDLVRRKNTEFNIEEIAYGVSHENAGFAYSAGADQE